MEKGNQRPISVSEGCFLPAAAALLPLHLIGRWAEAAGFGGIEAVPFRGSVLFGVPKEPAVPITSGHGPYNPIPIPRKAREFGKGAAVTDALLFPALRRCGGFLAELRIRGVSSINTSFVEELRQRRLTYNSFQAHPDLGMTLEEIAELLQETGAQVTYDLRHWRRDKDRRLGGGPSPFPNWRATWAALQDRVDNVHIQYLDMDELQGMLDGDETIELAVMLRHIAKSGYEGLFTLEVTMTDMARLFGPKAFLPQIQVEHLKKLRQFVEAKLA